MDGLAEMEQISVSSRRHSGRKISFIDGLEDGLTRSRQWNRSGRTCLNVLVSSQEQVLVKEEPEQSELRERESGA